MTDKTAPTRDELRALIAKQKAEPDLSLLSYRDQQEIIATADHPLRTEIQATDRRIRAGLAHHDLTRANIVQEADHDHEQDAALDPD